MSTSFLRDLFFIKKVGRLGGDWEIWAQFAVCRSIPLRGRLR